MAKTKTTGTEDTAPETTVETTVENTVENTAPETVVEDVVAQEVPLNPDTEVVPDATPAGYGSRDFHSPI
jgi:hypothetical protein